MIPVDAVSVLYLWEGDLRNYPRIGDVLLQTVHTNHSHQAVLTTKPLTNEYEEQQTTLSPVPVPWIESKC